MSVIYTHLNNYTSYLYPFQVLLSSKRKNIIVSKVFVVYTDLNNQTTFGYPFKVLLTNQR